MGQLSVNELWRSRPESEVSEYARMIPGCPALVGSAPAPTFGRLDDGRREAGAPGHRLGIGARLARFLLPQPDASDRFALGRMVATDLIVLIGIGLVPSFTFPSWGLPRSVVPVYAVLVTLFGFSEGLYKKPWEARSAPGIAISIRAVLFALGLACVAAYEAMPPLAVPVTFVISLAGLSAWRGWNTARWRAQSRDVDCRNVLIVGAGPVGRAIARALRNPVYKMAVRGFVDENQSLSQDVLGRIEDMAWLARAEFIDEVILALPNQPARVREAAEIAQRNHLDVRAVLDVPPDPWLDGGFERIGDIPVVPLHREPLPDGGLLLKRILDIAGSSLGIVLAGPLMAVVAVLIRRDTPGPAIYSAVRTGAKGRVFPCYKFRSMVTDAEQLKDSLRDRNQREGPIFKLDCDPRVTRVGRFIRKYSLDELPQLWNVLLGDMSLVGPRPHPVDEVNHYELQHYRRLDVKPGMTGLWQVTARKNPSFEVNMHLDLTYIENWSLFLDLRILLRTVRVLFAPEGV
jgi:exopolysaccharide biosynthesis polyprenyl glycosylphosphotransferase